MRWNTSFFSPWLFSSNAASAGESVRELKAEMTVEKAMVSANCLKNMPVNPLTNASGTKTADSVSAIAMMGSETSLIAL